ncbi:restriction endonuclease [Ureibacillus chungkukjangi]|uniref:restriction endonuclease n=1 Tax=Ureibacillus chungkukjangi TaxID=1202712 RepID=UPI00384BDF3E
MSIKGVIELARYYGKHRKKRKTYTPINRKLTLYCFFHGELVDYTEFNQDLIYEAFNKEKNKVELKCYQCLEAKIKIEQEKNQKEYSIFEKKAKELYGKEAKVFQYIGSTALYLAFFGYFLFVYFLGWLVAFMPSGFLLFLGILSHIKSGNLQKDYDTYFSKYTSHLQPISDVSTIISNEATVVLNWRNKQSKIKQEQARIKKEKINYSMLEIDKMLGIEFEHFVKNLLQKNGYENSRITKASGDEGVDIITYKNGKKIAVQCKRYSSKITNSAIQEVFSGMHYYNCHEAYVITNSYFTVNAISLANKHKVKLINRDGLFDMIENSNIQ